MKIPYVNLRQLADLVGRDLSRRCFRLGQRSRQLFFRACALPAFFALASTAQAIPVTISWSGWVTATSDGFGAIGSEVFQSITYETDQPNRYVWGNDLGVYYGTSYTIQSGATTLTNSGSFDVWVIPTVGIYAQQNNGGITGGNVMVNGTATDYGFRNRLWAPEGSGALVPNSPLLPTSLPNLPALLANIPAGSDFSGDLYTLSYGELLFAWDSAAPRISSPAPEAVPDHTGVGSLIVALLGVALIGRFKRNSARS